jgi:hypothetical protein
MTTAALGTYYDIGGLNGFSDANAGTPAATNAMGDNAGFGNYSRWLDYEKPTGYGLFASLDGGGEIDRHLWIKEVIIRSRQTSHQRTMANARSIHQAHAAFWRHPITRGVTTVLTSFVGGGIFSGMKNAYTAVKGYRYANDATKTFEIADGVRRAKAAQQLGYKTIEAVDHTGKVFQVPIKNLTSPLKNSIDISTPINKFRYDMIYNGMKAGEKLPPIYVHPGSRGISIFDITFF